MNGTVDEAVDAKNANYLKAYVRPTLVVIFSKEKNIKIPIHNLKIFLKYISVLKKYSLIKFTESFS